MPTFIHGKSSKVMISGYDASASIMSATASGQVETADVTCFGQSDKAYIVGLADATISAEGVYSGGTAEADEYLTALLGGTAIVWSLYEGGDTFGNPGFALPGVSSKYEVNVSNSDAVKFSAETTSGPGNVAVDRVLSLRAAAAATGTAAGSNLDGGAAASNNGWAAYVHVISGTCAAGTCIVEHSVDGSTSWATLATFTFAGTAASTGGIGAQYAVGTGTVRRYVRHNLTGLTGTVNFQVGFARR